MPGYTLGQGLPNAAGESSNGRIGPGSDLFPADVKNEISSFAPARRRFQQVNLEVFVPAVAGDAVGFEPGSFSDSPGRKQTSSTGWDLESRNDIERLHSQQDGNRDGSEDPETVDTPARRGGNAPI